jgi:N-acetyl-alpha-D-glucosaminyl L-malate synthase BshA
MKIAIMSPTFVPKWIGGIEIATLNVAQLLAAKGHEVHVLTSLDKGLPEESVHKGVFVHRILWKGHNFLANRVFELRMLRMLLKIHPQIVHVQTIRLSKCALLAKVFFQIPYVICGHGSDVYLSNPPDGFENKILLKNADVVIALTDHMKKAMQKMYLRDVKVVPNGINVDEFAPLTKLEARAKLQMDDDERVVAFVGSLREIKGVEYLVRATKSILETGTVIHTVIIGDGPDRERLESLTHQLHISSYVTFKGQIQNEQIPYYLRVSDVFVLPSLSEGFPVVLLEAMASGLPIVTTNVGGVPEIVRDRENGFIIEPKNAKEIADRVLCILKSEEITKRLSNNNKHRARDFGWELIVDDLEKIYSSCL